MKVSFVTPCYNSRDYIGKAIESVMRQSYADWELVIVDDGSDDGSLEICRDYASGNDRIRIIEGGRNSGCAYIPRKRAIEEARGEFIAPVDSDDWLDEEYLRILLEKQEERDCDIVYPVMYYAFADRFEKNLERIDSGDTAGMESQKIQRSVPSADFTCAAYFAGHELIKETLPWWKISAGGGLIRKETYKEAYRRYERYIDTDNVYADELLTRCLLYTAERVAFAEAPYYYRINHQSVTHGARGRLAYIDHLERLLRLMENESGEDSEEARRARVRIALNIFDSCRIIKVVDGDDKLLAGWKEMRGKIIDRLRECRREIDVKELRPELGTLYRMMYRLGVGAILRLLPMVDKIRKR